MIKTNKIPELRFKEFNDEWQEKRLDEIFKIGAGGDVSKQHMRKTKDDEYIYPIYANSVKKQGLYGYSDLYKEEAGCITVTGRGTLGVAIARDNQFYPIVRLLTLRPKEKGNIIFYENQINRVNFFIESTGVPQLTGPQISSYKIYIPNKDEQQKIAEFLTSVDERIELQDKRVKLLQRYKKGIMQKIFSQQIRFKDENGKDYPDWRKKKLSDLTSITTGKKDVNAGNPKGKYRFYTCAKKYTYSDEYSFEGEAIMIAGNAEVGLCQYYSGKFEAYQRTYVLQNFGVNSLFLFKYLSHYFRNYALSLKQTGAMSFIKLGMLKDFVVPIPSNKEQEKVAEFLTTIDDKIEIEKYKLRQAKQFKKALLQRMFV